MGKYFCLLVIVLSSISLLSVSETLAQTVNFVTITKIEDNKITYTKYKYSYSGQENIDISDLVVWNQVQGKRDIFNASYSEGTDFRVLLLKKGYAKLKNTTNAKTTEISAQNSAKLNEIGIWQKEPDTPSPNQKSKGVDWVALWKYSKDFVREWGEGLLSLQAL